MPDIETITINASEWSIEDLERDKLINTLVRLTNGIPIEEIEEKHGKKVAEGVTLARRLHVNGVWWTGNA